jgi:hypothetical protein
MAKAGKRTKRTKAKGRSAARAVRARTKTKAPAERAVRSKAPARDALDDFVDAAARALDLPIEAAWKGAVKTNLTVTLALAASFSDFPLPDDAEPAPVFTA